MVKIVAEDDISSPVYTSYSYSLNQPNPSSLLTPLQTISKIIPKSSRFTANIDITPIKTDVVEINTPLIKNRLNFSPEISNENYYNNSIKEDENEMNDELDRREQLNMNDSLQSIDNDIENNEINDIDIDESEMNPFYNLHKSADDNDNDNKYNDDDYDINQNDIYNNELNINEANIVNDEIIPSYNIRPIRKILPDIPSIRITESNNISNGQLLDTHGNVITLNVIDENVPSRVEFLTKKYPLSRSFRVGWGPNGKLIMPLRYSEKGAKVPENLNNIARNVIPAGPRLFSENRFGSIVVMRQIQTFNNSAEAVALLEAHSNFISESLIANNTNFEIDSICSKYSQACTNLNRSFFLKSTFELISILFSYSHSLPIRDLIIQSHININGAVIGTIDSSIELPSAVPPFPEEMVNEYGIATERVRLEKLSSWVKTMCVEDVKKSNPNIDDKIWNYLSCNQISEACSECFNVGDYRLSTLISQVGGFSAQNMKEMKRQIIDWQNNQGGNIWDLFDAKHKRIYRLLAGDISDARALNWIRGIGLQLWFCLPSNCGILEGLIYSYENSLSNHAVSLPLPNYSSYSTSELLSVSNSNKTINLFDYCRLDPNEKSKLKSTFNLPSIETLNYNDVRYSLLQLYSSPEKLTDVLIPGGISSDATDYSISFLLYDILHYLPNFKLEDSASSTLVSSFASQLEIKGLWQWAAYVLMYSRLNFGLGDIQLAVKDLINRNWPSSKVVSSTKTNILEIEKFLLAKANVPSDWIAQAKAFRAVSDHQLKPAVNFFIEAGMFVEAQNYLVPNVASQFIVDDEPQKLFDILDLIPGKSEGNSKQNERFFDLFWLYRDFYILKSQNSDLNSTKFLNICNSICSKLNLLNGNYDVVVNIALSQISSELIALAPINQGP